MARGSRRPGPRRPPRLADLEAGAPGADGSGAEHEAPTPAVATVEAAEAAAEEGRSAELRRRIALRNLRAGRAPGRAGAPGAGRPRPGAHVALPGAGRRVAARGPGGAGPRRRPPDADRGGARGRADAARPGDPRRTGAGAGQRHLRGGVHREDPGPRPARRAHRAPLPARAAAARAGRRARVHQPAPAPDPRRGRPGRGDPRRGRHASRADRGRGGGRPGGVARRPRRRRSRWWSCASSRRRSRTSASTPARATSGSRPGATGGRWILEVRDDGRGFDPDAAAAPGRRTFGLQFMRERAELVRGAFEVRSRPANGTVVVLDVPVPERGGSA